VLIVSLVLQALTLVAGLVSLVGVARLLRGSIDAVAWNYTMAKLLRAGDRRRAVRLCRAIPLGLMGSPIPLVDLTLCLLGLALPAVDDAPREAFGFRRTTPGRSFEERANDWAMAELARQQRLARRAALLALVPGALASAFGLVSALVQEQPTWRRNTLVFAAVSAIGAAWSLRVWQRQSDGLVSLVEALLPLLRPPEELDAESREAQADAARIARERGSLRGPEAQGQG
jgi:hypothetical protein